MKARYRIHSPYGGPGFLMPILDVRIFGPTGKSRRIEMLLDTGAAYNSIPEDVANELELQEHAKGPIVLGAGGLELTGPLCKARIALVDDAYEAELLVLPDNLGTLGHHDFFARRRATFDTRGGYFILERPRP